MASTGELVFDGVAISDTSATVRHLARQLALAPGPATLDRCRVQSGGAIYADEGTVTFRGNSTITRTRAVRLA
jgi:hypothetical protein